MAIIAKSGHKYERSVSSHGTASKVKSSLYSKIQNPRLVDYWYAIQIFGATILLAIIITIGLELEITTQ